MAGTKRRAKTHTRKLARTATYSLSVTIPADIIKKYGWREKQKLTLSDKGNGMLVIRDWKRR